MYSFLPDLFAQQDATADNFFLIAGPCVVESEEVTMRIAEHLVRTCGELKIPLVFKASYRKANRTKHDSFSGIGDKPALDILSRVKHSFGVPVTTDIHAAGEAAMAAEYIDMIQIPAFLCRQTDILEAAALTGKPVNIKKGQFLSPASMEFAVEKVRQAGNDKIIVTDRGTMLGYHDLVVDYRGIPVMQAMHVPVVLDCTHSVQQPNMPNGVAGGNPRMIETIARAAVAAGADGLFIETHPDPSFAKSDGANMLRLDLLQPLLEKLVQLRQVVNKWG